MVSGQGRLSWGVMKFSLDGFTWMRSHIEARGITPVKFRVAVRASDLIVLIVKRSRMPSVRIVACDRFFTATCWHSSPRQRQKNGKEKAGEADPKLLKDRLCGDSMPSRIRLRRERVFSAE